LSLLSFSSGKNPGHSEGSLLKLKVKLDNLKIISYREKNPGHLEGSLLKLKN